MMDAERFQSLAAAYGADLARWPDAERAQARAFMADDRRCNAWLAEEAALDSVLEAICDRPQNDLLRERIIRSAPKPAPVATRRPPWASWAGLAAACAAGVLAGAQLTSKTNLVADPTMDPALEEAVQASRAFADSLYNESIGDAG